MKNRKLDETMWDPKPKKPYGRVMFYEDGSSSMAPKKKGVPHLPSPATRQTYKGAYGTRTSPPGSKRGLV